MRMYTTRVSSKGQVTIPKALRDRLDLEQGDFLVMESHGDEIRLRKTSASVEDFDALAERIADRFRERGITKTEVQEAIRWARKKR